MSHMDTTVNYDKSYRIPGNTTTTTITIMSKRYYIQICPSGVNFL